MIYQSVMLLGALAFIYCTTSRWFERTPVNGALVYVIFGLVFGSAGLDLFDLDMNAEGLRVIAEITLGIVLFSDASGTDFKALEDNRNLPTRMLVIGLPLCILLGFVAGVMIFDELAYIEVAILATMLAPTDAALGKAVVSDKSVPMPIRTSLNVESGLNDGICVPVLLAFLAVATGNREEGGLLIYLLQEIGIGLAVGLALAWCGAKLLEESVRRGWITGTWRQFPIVSLAILCFTLAQLMHGSGFIAAFCGGLLFGRMAGHDIHESLESAEATGDLLSMVTWTVFGAAVVGPALGAFGWDVALYAVLSLTIIRVLPIYLSLLGTRLSSFEKVFMGWFGPRGLASIVFAVIVLGENLPGIQTMGMTVIFTVMLSVLLHGVSANPLVQAMASRSGSQNKNAS